MVLHRGLHGQVVTDGPPRLSYGTVRESTRQAIYAVRIHDAIHDLHEIDEIAQCSARQSAGRRSISTWDPQARLARATATAQQQCRLRSKVR
jgi:hypothetical protein